MKYVEDIKSDDMETRKRIVKESLKLLHILSISRYGDTDYKAAVVFLDIKNALEKAKLTDRQIEIITLVYIEDMSRVDVAERLGVSQQSISKTEEKAIEEIARHLR